MRKTLANMVLRATALAALALGMVACGGGSDDANGGVTPPPPPPVAFSIGGNAAGTACFAPDNLTRVNGARECLVVSTYVSTGEAATLLVLVHGDVSAGGPADYMYPSAQQLAGPNVVSVALSAAGVLYDSAGNQSTGTNYQRSDSYTPANIGSVADAIRQLKIFHRAQRVVLVGHSGGAAFGGVILGKYPDLLDAALLVSCPCDIKQWRLDHGWPAWTRSLSPHDFISGVASGSKVIAMTGSQDSNTLPHLAQDYVAALLERGVSAVYVEVAGATHSFSTLRQSAEFAHALEELMAAPAAGPALMR